MDQVFFFFSFFFFEKNCFLIACHGAGRASSRNKSRKELDYTDVLKMLADKGISIRVASPKLVMEEAPERYSFAALVLVFTHSFIVTRMWMQ